MDIQTVIAPPLENNIYLLGDSKEVLIIDAAGDAKSTQEVKRLVSGRKVVAVAITHGHFDHTMGVPHFKSLLGDVPVYLHRKDLFLWEERYPDIKPDKELQDSLEFQVGSDTVKALYTPGHTPGSTCFYWQGGEVVFSGDTLFPGGPGATRWDYSDHNTIINSIQTKLFSLPPATRLLPGHGRPSTIGTEAKGRY